MKATNRRKVLAILAGGLVLGVGAAVTLAAWNDSEFAQGTFTAGSFNLEGSTTSATTGFADHNVDDGDAAAALTFTAGFDNMSPTDVTYSSFWVRLDSATTNNATLVPTSTIATGDEANFEYEVYAIAAGAACDDTVSGTPIVVGATLSDYTPATAPANEVALTMGSSGAAGDAQQLCFVVTALTSLEQGDTATATWKFTATSTT